jgi:hypothetical protein
MDIIAFRKNTYHTMLIRNGKTTNVIRRKPVDGLVYKRIFRNFEIDLAVA